MRKVIVAILIIFSMIFLCGCIKNEGFDQDRVVSPEPISVSISGTWKIVDRKVLDKSVSNNHEEKDINADTICIGNNCIVLGDIKIENPKFKLKRVKRSMILNNSPEEHIINKHEKDTEYMDIISVYDNNKTYFNFIKNETENSYLYTTREILELEKINDNIIDGTKISNKEIIEKQDSIPVINKQYYDMDVGVLLGLKKPGKVNEKGEFQESKYRTLWVSLKDSNIEPIKELNNVLLLPRLNGFSKIKLEGSNGLKGRSEILTVSSKKKEEKEHNSILQDNNIYKDITFVGNDYIGFQYYGGEEFNNHYNKYKILPIDSVNINESIDFISLFGEEGKNAYEKAKQKISEVNKNNKIKNVDFSINDYRNITLIRKNGQWNIEGKLNFDESKEINFPIEISPIKVLINYDGIILPWSKIKEFDVTARDFVSSPNGRLIITLSGDKLKVFEVRNGDIKKELTRIPIDKDEVIVMSEWATGDFVSQWRNVVRDNGEKSID